MANSISLVTKFLPVLDEVYKRESVTSILDTANSRVEFIGANIIKLFTIELDGLGNYNRNTGYVGGDITAAWEQYQLTQDRGRSFMLDVMDNDETLGMTLAGLLSEFLRVYVVPEIDAYRFAKYASTANIDAATPADITSSSDVVGFIDEADKSMSNNEVPRDGRILFVSEDVYKRLKGQITRYIENDEANINRTVEMFDGMRVIRVPQNRFNTAITLYDGSTAGQTAGGYIVPASTSYKINFMIVHPSAVAQVVKHVVPRLFSPQQNLTADAWKYDYRIYHDAFVLTKHVKGIYLHRASTANS